MKRVKILTILIGITLVIGVVTTDINKTNVFAVTNTTGVTQSKELSPETVNENKEFTVTFSKDINKSTINKNTIKVLNSLNQEINVTVSASTTNSKVATIDAPTGGYVEGTTYSLVINQGVMDINNLALKDEVQMKFSITDPAATVASIFTDKNIKTMCNYSDLLVSGKNITLKDYDDAGKTAVKPTLNIPTAYMSNLASNYYAIANAIINPQMYTSLSYGDARRRTDYYNRVVIDYSKTSDYNTDCAFAYCLYTDNVPYIACQKIPRYSGMEPIGNCYLGGQILDDISISSYYKTNKILFGDNGNDISNEIISNYKLHGNDIKQFSTTKVFGNIRVEEIYLKDNSIISFFKTV